MNGIQPTAAEMRLWSRRRFLARNAMGVGSVALAWLLRQDGTIVIPKAARPEHMRENRGALDIVLTAEDLATLDLAFPPPKRRSPLGML